MSSNPDTHNTSTTLPLNVGNGSKESEQNSSLTVQLSDSATLVVSNENASALTTESLSNLIISTTTESSQSDATVIKKRSEQQESSGFQTANASPGSADNAPNANVKIVQDNLIGKNGASSFQLGDYQILEPIGGGGMGLIYLAHDIHLDRNVALKVLSPNQQTEEFRERFIVEAKASAKLHHDNIVSVYSFGQTDGITYLVMEYIPGSNIRDIVTKKGPLAIEDALSYAIQLASALEHIKEKGVVHRDIKPSNVLITDDGTVKVIDLGLAKFSTESSDDLTQTGVTLGTFDYISPEQARDPRNVDIRSDIYSFGCSLFFMLTGQPPYPKGTGLQKLLRHQGDAAPNVQDFRSDVPDRFADIIMRCMAKDASMRYQTPQDISKALFIVAEELGMRPSGISLAKWYLPSISRLRVWKDRLAWALPIVVLIIAIIVLDCFWKPDQRQAEFLPETPGLKRNIASAPAGGRSSPIFAVPVKKGRALERESVPQSFPQPPEEIAPTESEMPQAPVVSEEPTANDSNPDSVLPSAAPSTALPNTDSPAAPTPDGYSPEPTNDPVKVHSIKFETD